MHHASALRLCFAGCCILLGPSSTLDSVRDSLHQLFVFADIPWASSNWLIHVMHAVWHRWWVWWQINSFIHPVVLDLLHIISQIHVALTNDITVHRHAISNLYARRGRITNLKVGESINIGGVSAPVILAMAGLNFVRTAHGRRCFSWSGPCCFYNK